MDKKDSYMTQQDRRRRKKEDRGNSDFHSRLRDGFDMMEEDDQPDQLPPQVSGQGDDEEEE